MMNNVGSSFRSLDNDKAHQRPYFFNIGYQPIIKQNLLIQQAWLSAIAIAELTSSY